MHPTEVTLLTAACVRVVLNGSQAKSKESRMPAKRQEHDAATAFAELTSRVAKLEEVVRWLIRPDFRSGPEQQCEGSPPIAGKPEPWWWREAEVKVEPWEHLVRRQHPWKRQLFMKGRNMTVRQLVGTVKANKLSIEEAATDLDLPPEAVTEALHYAEKYKDLLEADAAYERYLLSELEGARDGAESLP
jgi:uncharacterized protein (DUF433 family)